MKFFRPWAIFFVCIQLLVNTGCGGYDQQKNVEQVKQPQCLSLSILDENQHPTKALKEVLNILDVKTDGSLNDIVEKTQKIWLRPSGVERFNMQDIYADKQEELMPLFKQLGLCDEVRPMYPSYKYALVHGGNILSTRARFSYLVGLWNSGIKFEKIVVLTGQRDLDKNLETVESLQKSSVEEIRKQAPWLLPVKSDWKFDPVTMPFKSETDMMKLIYDQTQFPDDFKNLPVVFIDAPKQKTSDGGLRRPSTADTINSWLTTNPEFGSCLFITNQPFIGYQDATVRTVMLKNDYFEIETVGFALQPGYDSISMILDSLARWLYQENVRLQSSKKNVE